MEAARARQPCHTCLPKIPAAGSAYTKAAPSRLYIVGASAAAAAAAASSLQAEALRVEDGQAQAVGQLLLGAVGRQQKRVEACVAGGQTAAVGAITLHMGGSEGAVAEHAG